MGEMTPETSGEYYHIVVKRGKVKEVSCQSTNIPKKAYAVVFNKNQIKREIELKEKAKYDYRLTPDDWNTMEYAVAAGPVLVRNGEKYIGEQSFQNDIIKGKAPRTAIGFTKENKLIILTVDGRQRGVSEGATLSELADLMLGFGAYQAMNLDGGSSTQMVVNGRLVNCPSTRRAAKVTNAILIYEK
jgi:exopolysaccharide biosynthesis protein